MLEETTATVGHVPTAGRHNGLPERLGATFSGRRWLWLPPDLEAVAVAIGAVVAFGGEPSPLTVLATVVVTYLVASRLSRRVSTVATATAAATIGAAMVYAALTKARAPLAGDATFAFMPLAAAWFVGDAVATRRRYLAGLADQEKRERAAEAEQTRRVVRDQRVRIAQEVHDVVAHSLAVMTVQAGVGRRLMAKRPEEARSALESIESIGRTAQEELHVVLGLLREEGTAAAELSPAPRLADLKGLVETVRASGTTVELKMSRPDHQLSPALELCLYRVVQEALTNVVKHAPSASATVHVVVSGLGTRAEIVDGGNSGVAQPGAYGPPGHGIEGMRERVGAFGGSLVAKPCPGGGFRVLAEVPSEGHR
jgi:signal transduction histidine kinase